ncbi:MAG: DUF87 domain-containing protein [Candidatus Eisenbacteria bacterium]|uniref:DUF87 domain-containing protein n=1 Tax=Eiseniibacteriota bacterium TaxID=2212470 RepID=A0A956SFD7_UNCEI|nr:DUF87 domain-containing protein [Candidatus Eisenbacteria bacterium]
MSEIYEKLGAFYLGKRTEPGAPDPTEDLVLYDAKDLTTHALCVGMTGSGKTGLCVTLLEEAAIDGIPALVIDPKGDLGNLLLTFPDLEPSSFAPWVDPAEATRKGLTPDAFAASTAKLWKDGLAKWGQDGDRIQRLRDAADFVIYTPGSNSGLPLKVLRSFSAPPDAILSDPDALREKINGTVSGLLGLIGIDADPIQSREHILLANLLDRAWREGRSLDLPSMIREIQSPPFDRIGVMDLEAIFPAKDRLGLSMRLNNLLASPGFSVWMEGDPLEIPKLLYAPDGRPRIAILSIAHLSEAERMFFVTLLLNELISWMRVQSGTSSLRALLYMDEIFGYFPPSKNPPSKTPMLTLLKQARAFGVGVVLSTQNPVDLDYKGLSNCGTWFLGRLQTERDKMRVIDGLEGAAAANSQSFDRAQMDTLLSGLGKRVFLMNNVHDAEPTLFHTRWALSYLRGPLTRQQIQVLMDPRRTAPKIAGAQRGSGDTTSVGSPAPTGKPAGSEAAATPPRPLLPPDVTERFLAWTGRVDSSSIVYRPTLIAKTRLHYTRAKYDVDVWVDRFVMALLDPETARTPWDGLERITPELDYDDAPAPGATFGDLPVEAERPATYKSWSKSLVQSLYRTELLALMACDSLDTVSAPEESEAEFRGRLALASREERDLRVGKLREKYEKKLDTVRNKISKAEERIAREEDQLKQQKFQTAISVGATVLGAFFGKKKVSSTNVGRATTAMRSASRVSREQGDLGRAEDNLESLQAELADLEREFQSEVDEMKDEFEVQNLELERVEIPPKKSEISVEELAVVWTPWARTGQDLEPLYVVEVLAD